MSIFTEDELTLFDNYTNGTMTEVDRINFKQQLLNEEIKNQFKLYLTIVNRIKTDAEVKFKLKERFTKIDKKQKRKTWFSWGMAASLAGIILTIFIFNLKENHPKFNIAQFVVLEPGISIIMSNDSKGNWTSIMQLFKQQEYEKAFVALQQKPISDTSLYFSGLFKELGNQKSVAINFYQQLNNANNSSLYIDKARYRLAIILWGSGNNKTAESLLHNISQNNSHIYQIQAKKALQELSKIQ